MLGLKKNLNLLVDYDPLWEAAFIEERKRLAQMLGNIAKGVDLVKQTRNNEGGHAASPPSPRSRN
jgi:GrpB-like predicted nucleotidyltransferase (UPF0157 family)